VRWTELAQDHVKWRALVLAVPIKKHNALQKFDYYYYYYYYYYYGDYDDDIIIILTLYGARPDMGLCTSLECQA